MIKKSLILALVLMFALQFVSASVSDSLIFGKSSSSRMADNSSAGFYEANPSVVKILVYADYDYYLPLVKSINASEYIKKISLGVNPSIKEDVKLEIDKTQNMYDYWGASLGKSDYSKDDFSPLTYGTGFFVSPKGHILTNNHLVNPSKGFFETWTRIHILETIENQINLKYVGKNYSSYESYIEDVALYTYLGANLELQISNFKIKVLADGKEYAPEKIYSEGNNDFSEPESSDISILKISVENHSYLDLADSSELNAAADLFILGYPSLKPVQDSFSISANYPSFYEFSSLRKVKAYSYFTHSTNPRKSFRLEGAEITEGQSGAPVLDSNARVIGMATFNYPKNLGGNYNYVLGSSFLKEKIAPYLKSSSNINGEDIVEKKSRLNWKLILGILILFLVLALIAGIIRYKSRNQINDKILIITRPKPSIFPGTRYESLSTEQVTGQIRTYY